MSKLSVFSVAALLALSTVAQAATVSYNFDYAAAPLQGWTLADLGSSRIGAPMAIYSKEGHYYLGTMQDENLTIDPVTGNYDSTKVAQSPYFTLDGTSNISANLFGGTGLHGGPALPEGGFGPDEITTFPVSPLTANVQLNGFLGLALWDVTDGDYVGATTNASRSSSGYGACTISTSGLDFTHVYSLHFIDQFGGIRPSNQLPNSWGWAGLGSVSFDGQVVPEPSTIALLVSGLIGLLAYAWRKQK